MKKFILNWLLKDSDLLVFINKQKNYSDEFLSMQSSIDDFQNTNDDFEYRFNDLEYKVDEYDIGDMLTSIEDLQEKVDAIVSPNGFEIILRAKVEKEVSK
tara:strand:+ start:627 stop:926 length:300 start_codon:yes stop_codon:yes gene_type:complete